MRTLFFLFALILLVPSLQAETDYETWLQNEGFYLLTPTQKEEFRKLSEPQKELYIRDLWTSLDPNPITPENEFQKDYLERFAVAKKRYGIPSDRAKIYLLLGKPNSVETHPNSDKYYPLELWSYYSLGFRGLPPSLELIFFKRWGVGDYRLYSPLFDGFKALTPSQMNFESQRARAQLKAHFDPQIVEAAERLSVGSTVNESEVYRMTLQDPNAMKKILIQNTRPTVETTIVYQGFDSQIYTHSVPHESGVYRTSVAIAVPPKYLTFEKDNAQYQGRVDLIGKIKDGNGNEVLKINDSPYLKMGDYDFEKAKAYLFGYHFDAYLLPGRYEIECLFRDYVSNAAGKFQKSFEVKALTGGLELQAPLLAFKSNPATSERIPFGYNFKQYHPKENSTFNNGQTVIIYSTLMNPEKTKLEGIWQLTMAIKKDGQNVLQTTEDLPLSSTDPSVELVRRVKLQSLVPGSYVLSVQLSRGQTTLVTESPFKVGDDPEILGRLRILAPGTTAPESYHSNLALQFYNANNLPEASKHVRIALDFAPGSYAARSLSARIEKAKGNTDAAIALYEKLLQEMPSDTEGAFLIGRWHLEKRQWQQAADYMKTALAAGYYTTEILNELALAEIQLGKTTEALEYWQKSLALNSNQPEIQKQIEQYKR